MNYELYDLIEDEKEAHKLIQENAQLASSMQKELEGWLLSVENSEKGNN